MNRRISGTRAGATRGAAGREQRGAALALGVLAP